MFSRSKLYWPYLRNGWSSCCEMKGSASVGYWINFMMLIIDVTHVLDLELSRTKFELALSKEWEGQLTWNETDMSRLFLTIAMTFVWPWWGGWMYWVVTEVTSSVWYKTEFGSQHFGYQLWWPFVHWLPKLVTSISSQFHHLVDTGFAVGIKVVHTCKLYTIWVVYCSPIGNGSIRL